MSLQDARCGPLKVGTSYLSATFTQQSGWLAMVALGVSGCGGSGLSGGFSGGGGGGAEAPVSGSSRQELPAESCLIRAPPVLFSAAAAVVISVSLLFVPSLSLFLFVCLFFISCMCVSVLCLSLYILCAARMEEAL